MNLTVDLPEEDLEPLIKRSLRDPNTSIQDQFKEALKIYNSVKPGLEDSLDLVLQKSGSYYTKENKIIKSGSKTSPKSVDDEDIPF